MGTTTTSHLNQYKMSEQEAEKKEDIKKEEPKKEAVSPDKSEGKENKENKDKKENKENECTGSATPEGTLSPEPAAANGESPSTPTKLPSLREQFRGFSKFGDTKSDGKLISLSQSDKWFKQAKVIDGKKGSITTTDTSIGFSKLK